MQNSFTKSAFLIEGSGANATKISRLYSAWHCCMDGIPRSASCMGRTVADERRIPKSACCMDGTEADGRMIQGFGSVSGSAWIRINLSC